MLNRSRHSHAAGLLGAALEHRLRQHGTLRSASGFPDTSNRCAAAHPFDASPVPGRLDEIV